MGNRTIAIEIGEWFEKYRLAFEIGNKTLSKFVDFDLTCGAALWNQCIKMRSLTPEDDAMTPSGRHGTSR